MHARHPTAATSAVWTVAQDVLSAHGAVRLPEHAAEPAAPKGDGGHASLDPIGVISEHNQDEYDSYSADIVRLPDRGATVEDIVNYMRWAVTERMCIAFNEPHSRECAEELVNYWQSRMGG